MYKEGDHISFYLPKDNQKMSGVIVSVGDKHVMVITKGRNLEIQVSKERIIYES